MTKEQRLREIEAKYLQLSAHDRRLFEALVAGLLLNGENPQQH